MKSERENHISYISGIKDYLEDLKNYDTRDKIVIGGSCLISVLGFGGFVWLNKKYHSS